ncbi:MAG: pirin family protein [Burkholderiaceae bacterium]|jgi:redox-sensitive bicupin YhaK (pirin superfamily)
MFTIRRSDERGQADLGWLKSRHSFSFASYQDPAHMNFGPLRVINEDWIAPGTGFGMHGHRDMEIITYVLEGAITHRDSMGNSSVIRAGSVQKMSAGTGVMHSEHNRESGITTHMLQIWITPDRLAIEPGYQECLIDDGSRRGRLALIASGSTEEGVVHICQDVRLWAGRFDGAEQERRTLDAGRRVYVHVARGALHVNGRPLGAGDAAMLIDEPELTLESGSAAEVLVFDLP